MISTSQVSIREHSKKTPDLVALTNGEEEITYRELYSRSRELGGFMLGSKHDVFYVYAGNNPDTLAALYGAALAGKTVVAIPDFIPKPVAQIIRLSAGAKRDAFKKKGYVCYDFPSGGTFVAFTSGTTGRPRAVIQPPILLSEPVIERSNATGLFGGERVFTTAPITAAPVTYLILLSMGCTVGYTKNTHPAPDDILEGYINSESTMLFCTPSILEKIVDSIGLESFPGLERVMTASMPFSDDLIKKLDGVTIPVMDVYASSETGSIAYRDVTKNREFTLFPGVEIVIDGNYGELAIPRPTEHTALGIMSRRGVRELEFPLKNGDYIGFEDGKITFIDRERSRVKVAGFAVSLDSLRDAAMSVRGTKSVEFDVQRGTKSDNIIMYVDGDPEKIRRHLEKTLPWYYVPREIYVRGT